MKNVFKIAIIIIFAFTIISQPFNLTTSRPLAWNTYNVGDPDTINVADFYGSGYKPRATTCVFVGPDIYIMKDNALGAPYGQATYEDISNKVTNYMLPLLAEYFAVPTDIDGNGKITIYIGEIPGVGGYFSDTDLSGGNYNGEIVYLNAETSIPLSTLVHELQHLAYSGVSLYSESRWFNEGCSTFSEFLYATKVANRSEVYGTAWYPSGTSLVYWDYEHASQKTDYQCARSFVSYLYDQFGAANLSAIYTANDGGTRLHSVTAIMHVVNQYYPDMTFDELFTSWSVANIAGNYKNQSNRFWYYKNFEVFPNGNTIPDGTLFGKKYPYIATVDVDPYSAVVYNLKDFPDPNDIEINVSIPDKFQNFDFSVGIIKQYRNNTMDPSTYEVETVMLNESNIEEGISRQLNQTSDGFKFVWVFISLLEGGDGGFYTDMPAELTSVKFDISVTSGEDEISTGTESGETDTEPSPETTNGLMIFAPLITLNFILFRRRKN